MLYHLSLPLFLRPFQKRPACGLQHQLVLSLEVRKTTFFSLKQYLKRPVETSFVPIEIQGLGRSVLQKCLKSHAPQIFFGVVHF